MTDPKPSRKRWKIALGVVVMFAAVGWLVAYPGEIITETVGPQWLRQWGFEKKVGVDLGKSDIADIDLKPLRRLPNFEYVGLRETNNLKLNLR